MARTARSIALLIACTALPAAGPGASPAAAQERDGGYAIQSSTVVARCARCHTRDDQGRLSRISYLRKTPEGWQTSIRRMMSLHGVRLEASEAAEIVRYLSNEQGLAPEELRPGLFEVERRMIDYDYPGDSGVEYTCIRCHSMGRVITQRRTEEEWGLLLSTHRALYPLVDGQAFRAGGGEQPMDAAIEHLSEEFPLETPEWSAWSATKRSPQLAGTWVLEGYEPGKGPIYGTMTITADPSSPDDFTTTATYTYAESGDQVSRRGSAIVYTGYQWRGRSNPGTAAELREVMFVERDLRTMHGRWFAGAYDEIGPDVTLRRVSSEPILAGVYPRALPRGETVDVTLYGGNIEALSLEASSLDFGRGITVERVSNRTAVSVRLRLRVASDAAMGRRDLVARGSVLSDAVVVHDGVDRIVVTPATGMARVGGANFPKGYQVFEAIGWNDGPDGEPETDDDLELGRVEATWRLEEYTATYGDDDVQYVGTIGADGVFVPAADGPNPERSGNRNNVGDVWVVATHRAPGGRSLSARAHLVVTVPLYMRWEPWRISEEQLPATGDNP